jgi:NAD(P)-dependent dehydrogenase (short-subunit alcohol dehydrogenase family)
MNQTRKCVIVYGAGGGLGRAAVVQLAEQGVAIVGADRNQDALARTEDAIAIPRIQFEAVIGDVTEEAHVRSVVETALRRFGRLDGVLNAAAINGPPGPFLDVSLEGYEMVMRVNVRSVWLSMQYALPELIKLGGGAIVNVGSVASIRAAPSLAAYTGSKHAVAGLTKTVAVEYAKQNVRVNLLCPGSMNTELVQEMLVRRGGGDAAAGLAATTAGIPDGRLAEPEELAQTAVWLLLDAPQHLTGQLIMVDGAKSAI